MDVSRAHAAMVSATLVEKIQHKYGGLFGAVSTDIYSATLISIGIDNRVVLDYPVVVPEFSGVSTTGAICARGMLVNYAIMHTLGLLKI